MNSTQTVSQTVTVKSVPSIAHVSAKRREVQFENGVLILLCGYPRSIRQLSEAATDLYEKHLQAGFTHEDMVNLFGVSQEVR